MIARMSTTIRTGALVSLLLVLGAGSRAQSPPQQFAADIVKRDSAGAVVGPAAKLYVSDLKTRIEAPEASGGYFITDAEAGTALFVRAAQHVFMDAKQSTPLTRIFIRVDPRDPCRQWEAAALVAGIPGTGNWRCDGVKAAAVIDPELRFPIKWQSPDGGTFALENIRNEAQPAYLFAVPAGYRKLDPQALVEQIKRSDVWAPASPSP
jgi:hypothetical protein